MKLLGVGALMLLAGCGPSSSSSAAPDLAREITLEEPDLAVPGDLSSSLPGDDLRSADLSTAQDDGPPEDLRPPAGDLAGADPTLELYLTFDTVSAPTVSDSSGHGRDGTLQGDAVISAGGKFGSALSLTGTKANTQVALGNVVPFTGAITLEVWVKPAGAQASWAQLLSRWSDAAGGYWLGGSSTPGNWDFFIGSGSGTSNAALQPDTWQHLAATYTTTGAVGELFVNGVHDSGGPLPDPGAGPTSLVVGGNNGVDSATFNGLIDEVRIYSEVRSQAEICADAGGTPGAGATCTLP